jgi:hypothetical protein
MAKPEHIDLPVSGGSREEVANVVLAQLLNERGVVSVPEQIKNWRGRRHMPDVLVVFEGLRTAIEGKYADRPNAEEQALAQAHDRVESGVAHIGIAVLYPSEVRKAPNLTALKEAIKKASLRIAVVSEAGGTGWTDSDLNYLSEILRHTFDQLVKEDVVIYAVGTLDEGITEFADALTSSAASQERAAEILGIGEPEKAPPE